MQELERYTYWLAVMLTPGVGSRLSAELLKHYGTPERVFAASKTELESCGLPGPVSSAIASGGPLKAAEQELEKIRQQGCRLLAWDEPDYPALLKEIYDPPVLLYYRGDASVLSTQSIAMVGARSPSPYGRQVAERLAEDLAARGLTIVSGLARGIDTCGHRGALKAGGKTIAVLGCGIDVDYPKENRKLRTEIEQNGCLVTEFLLGTFPAPQNFPIRNRIVAGLSWGAIVVEGGRYSGSLITGRLAMEYNRQVYGVPGNITNQRAAAPNLLIKQGAKLVETWEDVVEELPTPIRSEILERLAAAEAAGQAVQEELPLADNLSAAGKKVFGVLKADEAFHVDHLVEAAGLSPGEVLTVLLELEMKGMIRQLPGKNFLRVLGPGSAGLKGAKVS